MLTSLCLNGNWKLRGFDGQHGLATDYCTETVDERTFIDAEVPGEIHLDLERAGILPDRNVGLNAQSARWVEEQEWVYRTLFTAPAEAVAAHSWLVFDGLDLNAVVYLNGEEIGSHANAFTPCRLDVTGKLREGVNSLAVYVESGLYSVSEKSGVGYCNWPDHVLHKRTWLRKPQYSFSWDWNPRFINVGISKSVRLDWTDSARIDAVTVFPELSEDYQSAKINTRVFIDNTHPEPLRAVVRMRVAEVGIVVEREIDLPSGLSRQDMMVEVTNPKLWWPRPHGDQPLYTVECEVVVDGEPVDRVERRTGIRSIRINQDPHPECGEYFTLEVNGRKIFAKGGNWIPPDMVYSKTNAADYRALVQIAKDANFNALRIWGGGLYANHAMLDACDEMGILVWHDFMFACSKYPADDPEFLDNVREEVTFAVRDLSPHPSLMVWCGNNEQEWATWDWGFDQVKAHPDYALYHMEIPRIMKQEDPSRPYWPSSPYSTEHRDPTDPTTGDQHPWGVPIEGKGPDIWAYRSDVSRFPNEGGVPGVSSPATLAEFIPEDQRHLFSPVWEFHDNACNYRDSEKCPYQVIYKLVEYWLGCQPDELSFDDYAFYSAVIQSEGLQEYINNFRRRMFSTSSAIFWMFNDSWPVNHGWSIVDYYLRRKLAYFPVRRAFSDIQVVLVTEGDKVLVYGINDTSEPWQGMTRFGLFRLAGGLPVDTVAEVTLEPNSSAVIGEMPLSKWQSLGAGSTGAFALLQNGRVIAQNRLLIAKFKDLEWADPCISIERRGERLAFLSKTFVWGVCLDRSGEQPLPDDMFDLLPGIDYEIDWPSTRPIPVIERCASAPGQAGINVRELDAAMKVEAARAASGVHAASEDRVINLHRLDQESAV
ncbi:MAG: sugar-binding domain-containing protein [Armatimonadota bacterium]|nr:hypothetical protein [bacterium]